MQVLLKLGIKRDNKCWLFLERETHKRPSKTSNLNFVKQASKTIDHSLSQPLVSTIAYHRSDEVELSKNEIFIKNTNEEHKIGIKDLCSEDKARIANLVKELAK